MLLRAFVFLFKLKPLLVMHGNIFTSYTHRTHICVYKSCHSDSCITLSFTKMRQTTVLVILMYIILNTTLLPSVSTMISKPPSIFTQTTEFFLKLSRFLKQEEVTPVIIGSSDSYCKDIINDFISNMSPIPIVISNHKKTEAISKHIRKPDRIFVFANSVKDIEDRLRYSDIYTSWNVRAFMHFIICFPVNDQFWIKSVSKLIWSKNIVNFILVYYHKSLQVITYNPFLAETINLTNVDEEDAKKIIFSNKLHNMNGHQLRVSFFADPPRIVEKDGIFYGADYTILRSFIQRLNATLKIVAPKASKTMAQKYYNHYRNIVNGKSDFGFVGCFSMINLPKDVDASYPKSMDDIVLLVPTAPAITRFFHILSVFHQTVWFTLDCAFLVTVVYEFVVLKYFLKERMSFIKLLLKACTLVTRSNLNRKFAFLKMLPLFWIFVWSILDSLFCSLLISRIVTPKFPRNLETLDELKTHSLRISLEKFYTTTKQVQYPLNLIDHARLETIIEKLSAGDTSSVYALQISIAKLITTQIYKNGRPVYYILKEHLIPTYSIYPFPINSPYKEEVDK